MLRTLSMLWRPAYRTLRLRSSHAPPSRSWAAGGLRCLVSQARASRPAGPPQFSRFMPSSLIHTSSIPTMNEPSFPHYLSSHFSRLRASAPAPPAEGAA